MAEEPIEKNAEPDIKGEHYLGLEFIKDSRGINIRLGSQIPPAIRAEVILSVVRVLGQHLALKMTPGDPVKVTIDPNMPDELRVEINAMTGRMPQPSAGEAAVIEANLGATAANLAKSDKEVSRVWDGMQKLDKALKPDTNQK